MKVINYENKIRRMLNGALRVLVKQPKQVTFL